MPPIAPTREPATSALDLDIHFLVVATGLAAAILTAALCLGHAQGVAAAAALIGFPTQVLSLGPGHNVERG